MEADLVILNSAQVEREKIKKKRPFGFGGQADQFTLIIIFNFIVNIFDISRFAAQTRTIINNFKINFPGRII